MRQLTSSEQQLVKKIVQLKQSARLEELQVARLLRKELECFALRWTSEPQKALFFYSLQGTSITDVNWDNLRKNYFKIADFLYFIEELEQEHFIRIQTLSFDLKTDEERVLYDRKKYKYKPSDDTFWGVENDITYLVPINAEHKVYVDFVDYLEKYANKVIYPLPLLDDLVTNNYKSIEQRNFEKQIDKTNSSLKIAFAALIISAIIPFLVDQCAPPNKMDNAQLKTIEQAIISNKTTWPNTINIQLSDTLRIKNIPSIQKSNRLQKTSCAN